MKNYSFINKPIVIFRGDDTSAFNLRSIKIILKGDLDLSNAIAKFTLLDYRKEWTVQEVASGELTMSFTSADTKAMPLGEQTGTFRLYDMSTGEPRQLTVVNKIPFLVTNRVCELDDESYHADVSVASGEIISIEFNVGVGAVNGKADKVKNAVEGDIAGLDDEGNLTDSGIPASDVLRKSQMDTTPTAGSLNPVTSGGIKQAIDDATPSDYEQVKAQVEQNATDIDTIEAKIPSQASAQNQLADKAFVNSSIATNTATFRGTYNLVTDLSLTISATHEQVAAAIKTKLAALLITPENNDYCFVQVPKSNEESTVIVRVDRYKCTVESGASSWDYEWSLNNSSFTAEQWAAINSGITSALVTKLDALPTAQELAAALLAKYEKPSTGIPKTDLSAGVQASLDKADSALQTAPVTSVNGQTGAVSLSASDVGAIPIAGGIISGNLRFQNGPLFIALVPNDAFGLSGPVILLANTDTPVKRLFITPTGILIGEQGGAFIEFPSVSGTLALLSDIAVKSVKLNGTALTPDANGAVDVPALPLAGGTMTGVLNAHIIRFGNYDISLSAGAIVIHNTSMGNILVIPEANGLDFLALRSEIPSVEGLAPLESPVFTGTPIAPNIDAQSTDGQVANKKYVDDSVAGIMPGPDNTKLNSTAAGPNFQTGVAYAVGKHVTYNGVLYECVVAIADSSTTPDQDIYDDSTTPATGHWKVTDMTDPDAVLDITAQNQLRVVAKDGTLLWAQGYDLASTSSATLACDAVNNFTFAAGATTQAFTLPTAPTGKVGDFILDIDNSANTGAATMTLTWLDSTFSVVVPKGESLTDMLAFAAGELAELYFTKTTFLVNNLPTWKVVKQVVENGGAQS